MGLKCCVCEPRRSRGEGRPVKIPAETTLSFDVATLAAALVILLTTLKCNGWRLTRGMAWMFTVEYASYFAFKVCQAAGLVVV